MLKARYKRSHPKVATGCKTCRYYNEWQLSWLGICAPTNHETGDDELNAMNVNLPVDVVFQVASHAKDTI